MYSENLRCFFFLMKAIHAFHYYFGYFIGKMNVNFTLLLLETINVNVKRNNHVTNIIFNHVIWNFESLIQSF